MSDQLDHSYKQNDKSVYQLVKVFSLNSGSTVTFSATSTQQSVFNLSSNIPWNFSRSYISFDLTLSTPTNVAVFSQDTIPIDNIQLLTQSGSQLASLYNVQPFSRVVPALTTDLQDYLTRGPCFQFTTKALSRYNSTTYCQPSNALISTANAANVPLASYIYASNAGPTVQIWSDNLVADQAGTDKNYIGKQRFSTGTSASASVINCKIPLKSFSGTILSMDRDYIFPQNLQLVVNWSNHNQFLEESAVIALAGTLAAVSYSAAVIASNLYLYAARQINSNLVAQSMANLASGYEANIPFTVCGKNSSGASGLYSAIQVVTPGGGMCLKRIINIACSPTTTLLMANICDNVLAHMYSTVQTYLDANPLQQTQLAAGTGNDDYEYMYEMLKGSVGGMSLREFQINSCFVDNFSSNSVRSLDWAKYDDVNDGLVLGQSSKNYNAQFTLTPAGGNIFQYIVYLRRLRIDSNGVNWI